MENLKSVNRQIGSIVRKYKRGGDIYSDSERKSDKKRMKNLKLLARMLRHSENEKYFRGELSFLRTFIKKKTDEISEHLTINKTQFSTKDLLKEEKSRLMKDYGVNLKKNQIKNIHLLLEWSN